MLCVYHCYLTQLDKCNTAEVILPLNYYTMNIIKITIVNHISCLKWISNSLGNLNTLHLIRNFKYPFMWGNPNFSAMLHKVPQCCVQDYNGYLWVTSENKRETKKKTLRKRFPKSALEVKNIANLKHLWNSSKISEDLVAFSYAHWYS